MGETSFCLRPNKNSHASTLCYTGQCNGTSRLCHAAGSVQPSAASTSQPSGEKSEGCLQLSCRSPEPSPWRCLSGPVPLSARCAGTATTCCFDPALIASHLASPWGHQEVFLALPANHPVCVLIT